MIKEHTMTEWEIYEKHCKGEFADIKASIASNKDEVVAELRELRRVLLGNGKSGVVTNISNNTKDIDSLKSSVKWAIGVGTAVLTGIGIPVIWKIVSHVQGP